MPLSAFAAELPSSSAVAQTIATLITRQHRSAPQENTVLPIKFHAACRGTVQIHRAGTPGNRRRCALAPIRGYNDEGDPKIRPLLPPQSGRGFRYHHLQRRPHLAFEQLAATRRAIR